jgi:formylglycine-generating enzyme required for sulfatase activity
VRAAAIGVSLAFAACTGATADRWTEPESGIVFVRIPAGEFVMGSPESEPGHEAGERPHRVRLSRSILMAQHEVTEGQWHAVMTPGQAPASPRRPKVDVTYFDVQQFLERLNAGGRGRFRLPTEAEWEYACRAGTTTPYHTGDRLTTDQANYNGGFPLPGQAAGTDRGALTDAGSFAPNAWGLFDMHGNAWEWTSDDYCEYADDAVDPVSSCAAALKVIRGGSWRFNADSARCALRYTHRPQDKGDSLGFRVVRE